MKTSFSDWKQVEPTFAMNDQFIYAVMHKVFDTDALESSRPMSIAVNTPAEIDQVDYLIFFDEQLRLNSLQTLFEFLNPIGVWYNFIWQR